MGYVNTRKALIRSLKFINFETDLLKIKIRFQAKINRFLVIYTAPITNYTISIIICITLIT